MKRYPYISAIAAATLLAIVVWLCVPGKYTAITKLSDEYKETELAIGFNTVRAHLKDALGGANSGINDMEIYCKILKTEDFARSISHMQLAEKSMTYGEYLNEKDTIEAVQDNINYNYSNKQATLTVSFADKDPVIAAQMLDSVTAHLQEIITHYRQSNAQAALLNAQANVNAAKEKYKEAQARYNTFAESHTNPSSPIEEQEEQALAKECKTAYSIYHKAAVEYSRQLALKQRAYLSFAVIQNNTVPEKPDNRLMGYIFSFVLISIFITFVTTSYCKRRNTFELKGLGDFFSPLTLTIAIWAIILGLYYALETDLYPITKQFYLCFIIWIPIFLICTSVIYALSSEQKPKTVAVDGIDYNKYTFYFFFIVSLIITPLYVYRVIQIVTMFGTEDLMTNIRTLALYGEGQGILNYSVVINQALFVVALWAHPKVPTWQVVILGIACLMNSLAIMEKGSMFFVFVSSVFVLFEKKVIKIRSILLFSVILFIVFYLFNLGRAGEGSDYQKEETMLDFFIMYVLSPPVAFCQLPEEVAPQFGTNTFEVIYLFLSRLGIGDFIVKDKLQEFVFVPVSTNVYTIFQPFFIDFGYRGTAVFAGIYGCIIGWIYRQYKNGNGVGACLYTYAVYVLLLQFYQENVFYSLVFVLQFTFFIVLFTQKRIKLSL